MTLNEPLVIGWMQSFAAAVRARRFDLGRALFHPASTGFGTLVFRADSREDLEARQWGIIWPRTRDFDFDYGSAIIQIDVRQAVVMAGWTSHALSAESERPREGRATIVLRLENDCLLATHTHFSLRPDSPAV